MGDVINIRKKQIDSNLEKILKHQENLFPANGKVSPACQNHPRSTKVASYNRCGAGSILPSAGSV